MYNGDGRERSLILLSYSLHNKTRLRFDVRGLFEARKGAAIRFVRAPPIRGVYVRQHRAFNHLEQLTCRGKQW